MKLVISEVARQRQLSIDVDALAQSYGLKGTVTARLVYESDDEFLESLDDDRELGGEG